jgi:hypothetical protein
MTAEKIGGAEALAWSADVWLKDALYPSIFRFTIAPLTSASASASRPKIRAAHCQKRPRREDPDTQEIEVGHRGEVISAVVELEDSQGRAIADVRSVTHSLSCTPRPRNEAWGNHAKKRVAHPRMSEMKR